MKPVTRACQQATKLGIPLNAQFDLTYRCHQRCLHCYLPDAWRQGEQIGPELDTGQVKGILDQLAAAGTFLLAFSGGEIFLRPDLMEILYHARRQNFSITLLTTGTRGLGAEECRSLAELGLEAIHVSLYSLQAAVHDAITQTSGSWALLMETLAHCRVAGIRVGYNCLVSKLNYRELPALKEYADRQETIIRFDHEISVRWDGRPQPSWLALEPDDLQYVRNNWGTAMSAEPLTVTPSSVGGCQAGITSCYIGASGEVWPCVDLPWSCGNLQNGASFESIWRHSEPLVRVRRLQAALSRSGKRICDGQQERQTQSKVVSDH